MNEEKPITEKLVVKQDTRWSEEEAVVLETIQKAHLRLARIIYEKANPPKRCIAISKNRKSIAWDIEMAPVIVNYIVKMTPKHLIPAEFMTPDLDKVWTLLSK
jgi:hypothetical protein